MTQSQLLRSYSTGGVRGMTYEFGSNGEMIPIWENGSSMRKTCLNAALSTTNPKWTVPEIKHRPLR